MSAPDFSRATWRLKIERAKQHLVELEKQIRIYSQRHPYRIRWERKPKRDAREWRCVLEITEKPDLELAVIIGDVIHNIRSALDHLAVAIAPSKRGSKASFPIATSDPWATKSPWHWWGICKDKPWKSFEKATRDMPKGAIAIIKQLQPYASWTPEPNVLYFFPEEPGTNTVVAESASPETHFLSVLSRLDNVDKHRDLIAIDGGPMRSMLTLSMTGGDAFIPWKKDVLVPYVNGTVVHEMTFDRPIAQPDTEMEMHIDGTLHVVVNIGGPERYADVITVLRAFTIALPRVVFGALEPFARS
jgi:hypothetical protein